MKQKKTKRCGRCKSCIDRKAWIEIYRKQGMIKHYNKTFKAADDKYFVCLKLMSNSSYCDYCYTLVGNSHDCDNCPFCGTDGSRETDWQDNIIYDDAERILNT